MLDNSPAWVVLDLALVRLGWPSLPIPAFFTPAQRSHVLTDAGADFTGEQKRYLEGFYGSFGFETISEPYLEDDIWHIDMRLPH